MSATLSTQAKKGWFSTDKRVWAICSQAIFQMSAGIAAAQSDGLIFTHVWNRAYTQTPGLESIGRIRVSSVGHCPAQSRACSW